ncbi:MAG: cation:proton antiporter [Hyphomonadaceae bacterium]
MLTDIAACIGVAFAVAVACQWLRQPLIVAYLAAGFISGPLALGWVHDRSSIDTIAELGLIFLLFMIGLEIDLKKILRAGRTILMSAFVQIAGCGLIGLAAAVVSKFALGAGRLDAVYIALAATFSSTVIIVKLLYEKRELDTFTGRITLGVLVLQDVAAILFLALQRDLANPSFAAIGLSLVKVVVLVVATFATSRFLLPPLFRSVARLPELVLVGALAWCFLVAQLAASLSLSREMGALLAGVALSTFPYNMDVAGRVNTLRDFFVTLFFVSLGMQIPLPTPAMIGGALLVAAMVVASRFLTVFPALYMLCMGIRGAFLPALQLSQISEFVLVMVAIGVGYHHLSAHTTGVILYAFVILAALSSYAIISSEKLLARFKPLAKAVGLRDLDHGGADAGAHAGGGIYLLGFSWSASSLLEEISRRAPELLAHVTVIDFNPHVMAELNKRGVRNFYGDITRPDILHHAGVAHADIIICTLPNTLLKGSDNLRLTSQLRAMNQAARIICHAEKLSEVESLYAAGANHVSVTRLIEAQHLLDVLHALRQDEAAPMREALQGALRDRREVIP